MNTAKAPPKILPKILPEAVACREMIANMRPSLSPGGAVSH
jgi:hypothetical protein